MSGASNRQTVRKTNRWMYALHTGFYAGVIWGLLKLFLFILKFTKVPPAFLVEPFMDHAAVVTWSGHLIGWASFILFSIVAAFLYMILLGKARGPWPGIYYGAAWWAMLYLLIGPLTGMMKPPGLSDGNSLISDGSLFLMWGVFIGYTIANEFTDERLREPVQQ